MNHSFKLIPLFLIVALLLSGCQEEAPLEEIIRPVKALKVADADTFQGTTFNGIARPHGRWISPFASADR